MMEVIKLQDAACAGDNSSIPALPQESPAWSRLSYGFFSRTGGASSGIYASLNCGRGSKDGPKEVEENRARVARKLGVEPASLIGPYQVHSAKAVIATAPWSAQEAPEADAIVTNARGLAIGVLTADCAPILLADIEAGVIAAVHAGWKGAKAGVIEAAVDAMESLGARACSIAAAVGPTISEAAYEVGPEFVDAFVCGDRASRQYFSNPVKGGRPHFDLPRYVADKLKARGVSNVQDTALCTYRNESLFFSNRRAFHRGEPDYGRQIAAILLP